MDSREKTIKLLEAFLSDKMVDGVCGYMVVPDDGEDSIQVVVVLDIDYINQANTKPGFVAKMIRNGVKQEIKKWLGIDVYVGSTAKKCDSVNPTESKKPTKYIITENQYRLIRREAEIKKLIDDSLELIDSQNDLTRRGWNVIPLQNLSLIVAEYVSNTIATESNLDGDDYVIFRNQIKQYIKNNFYDYLKEFWESKQ